MTGTEAAFRVTREGEVYADRAYFCGLASGCFNAGTGADIAESIRMSEPVAPGDLVELDPRRPGHYRKTRRPYSTLVAGVISTASGIVMGIGGGGWKSQVILRLSLTLAGIIPQAWESAEAEGIGRIASITVTVAAMSGPLGPNPGSGAPTLKLEFNLQWTVARVLAELERDRPLLALLGVVPVKATTENGPIQPGDLLVSSSTPGYAMRCGDSRGCEGALIGKALEPLQEGRGIIKMLVMQ